MCSAIPCAYLGYQLDFSADTLQQLYGSHDGYVKKVTKDVNALVKEGSCSPRPPREQIAAARDSDILS